MINKKLKEIDIDGNTFYYKIVHYNHEYGWSETEFYYTNDVFKTISIFGFKINYYNNQFAFKIDEDIESCYNSKSSLRKDILKAMNRKQVLADRCSEIKNGQII